MPNLKMLLVDDEPEILELNREFIEEAFPGSVIVDGKDGIEGFRRASELKFDIIVTDFQMPNMNGGDMIKQIRAESNLNRDVPVLMMTGYVDEAKTSLTNFDGVHFLEKPASAERLIRLIRLIITPKDTK